MDFSAPTDWASIADTCARVTFKECTSTPSQGDRLCRLLSRLCSTAFDLLKLRQVWSLFKYRHRKTLDSVNRQEKEKEKGLNENSGLPIDLHLRP